MHLVYPSPYCQTKRNKHKWLLEPKMLNELPAGGRWSWTVAVWTRRQGKCWNRKQYKEASSTNTSFPVNGWKRNWVHNRAVQEQMKQEIQVSVPLVSSAISEFGSAWPRFAYSHSPTTNREPLFFDDRNPSKGKIKLI